MLACSASGIYWLGRYLERAQHLCRLLRLQTEALVDRPLEDIYSGWRLIYSSIGRTPPSGALELDSDDNYTLADSYTLADDLTFERSNPGSVWSCFASGRENARQTRHCISAEMWTSLNLSYLRVQRLGMGDIWPTAPESFYAELAREIDTFSGVAAATMYRDDGWSFLQLGRFIERAHLLTGLLLAKLGETEAGEPVGSDWGVLLRAYHGVDLYNRRHGVEVHPSQALDLLVADPVLPKSLSRSLDGTVAELAGAGPGPDRNASAAAQRLANRLSGLVHYEWPDREDKEEFLQQVWGHCLGFHNLVANTYFDYQPE